VAGTPPAGSLATDHDPHGLRETIEATLDETQREYAGDSERPLGGYVRILATYGTVTLGLGLYLRRRRHLLPERLALQDIGLVALATHKLSRTLSKDTVTSPIRAPFTRYKGSTGPSELREEVRVHGKVKAVGELLTCPFCMSQWIATSFVFGLVVAPRATRLVASLFSALALSDLMQFVRSAMARAAKS
jgi:hypothetical protein